MSELAMTDRVIRKFGVNRTHVVRVPVWMLSNYTAFGKCFVGIQGPVIALCGTRALGPNDVGVCMKPGTAVLCRTCVYASGWPAAPSGNDVREAVAS